MPASPADRHPTRQTLMTRSNVRSTNTKRRLLRNLVTALTIATTLPASVGCHVWDRIGPGPHDTTASYHRGVGLSIEYPEVAECETAVTIAAEAASAPHSLEDPSKLPTIELSLEEAVAMAMRDSPVIRSLPIGATFSTQSATTVFDPAQMASSTQGVEAALAEYDAQYNNSLYWSGSDTPRNVLVNAFTQNFQRQVDEGTSVRNLPSDLSSRSVTSSITPETTTPTETSPAILSVGSKRSGGSPSCADRVCNTTASSDPAKRRVSTTGF